jgi:hypothetical protein
MIQVGQIKAMAALLRGCILREIARPCRRFAEMLRATGLDLLAGKLPGGWPMLPRS